MFRLPGWRLTVDVWAVRGNPQLAGDSVILSTLVRSASGDAGRPLEPTRRPTKAPAASSGPVYVEVVSTRGLRRGCIFPFARDRLADHLIRPYAEP
jgi:hypothetical protein